MIGNEDGRARRKGGDRHGLESGSKIEDISYASLAVHAVGIVSLFLARVHKDLSRGSERDPLAF